MTNNKFLSSFFHINNETYVPIFLTFLGSSIVIIPNCIHGSIKKLKYLKDSENNNSYCVISEYMLIFIIASLVF